MALQGVFPPKRLLAQVARERLQGRVDNSAGEKKYTYQRKTRIFKEEAQLPNRQYDKKDNSLKSQQNLFCLSKKNARKRRFKNLTATGPTLQKSLKLFLSERDIRDQRN